MKDYDMPIGFGMALAQNPAAMEKFAALPDSKKQEIISGTHAVASKKEMHLYVENIIRNY